DKNCHGNLGVLLGNGDGTLRKVQTYNSGGHYAFSVAFTDVNGDGDGDVLIANQCDQRCRAGSVSVLLGDGDGTFQAPVAYSSGGLSSYAVAVGDVNADHNPDVVVANYCAQSGCPDGSVSVLLGNGDGTLQAAQAYSTGGLNSYSVSLGD